MVSDTLARQIQAIRRSNWEYWPTMAFYWPMVVYGPLLALRYGHPCFFSAANPSLYISGLGLESKFSTLELLPEAACPKSVLLPMGATAAEIQELLENTGLQFPLVVKPDIGFRGLLVYKVATLEELLNRIQGYSTTFIVQEWLDYPEEAGIFYSRIPGEPQGKVLSVTLKSFLQVEGDGVSTVLDLMAHHPRALTQLARIEKETPELLLYIPSAGEVVLLGNIGNHSKGTQFINGLHLIDEELNQAFDKLATAIPGFFYGRFDIKYRSLELLKKGEDFKIIELNGIGAEPTHIYDQSRQTYIGALWTIMRYWTLVGKISAANHRRGVPYIGVVPMLKALVKLRKYVKHEATGRSSVQVR